MKQENGFRIDVDNILQAKAPKYYHRIPRFLINYLKRTLHQDDINGILSRNSEVEGVAFMRALVDNEFKLSLRIKGEENIPDSGKFTFASNHPLGVSMEFVCLLFSVRNITETSNTLSMMYCTSLTRSSQSLYPSTSMAPKQKNRQKPSTMLMNPTTRLSHSLRVYAPAK